MRILWIVNSSFPEAQQLLTGTSDTKGGGGWLYSMANSLVENDELELCVVTTAKEVKDLVQLQGEKIIYCFIPYFPKQHSKYHSYMLAIKKRFKPDIVNIHGTELPYGLSYVEACGAENVVVTIQGLISEIAKYYCAGLTRYEIFRNITFRDIIRQSILGEQKDFESRGQKEKELLSQVNYVIGRTDFDYAHVKAINPSINYYHCSEVLRDEFYSGQWQYENCERHSMFVSQAQYPVKGVHLLFKALPILMAKYPDVKLYISGENITNVSGFTQYLRRHGYSKILTSYIKKLRLEDNVFFTGPLSAEEMKERLLRSNVFVCPSSIENSSNSLCEAQMLGVPSVASFVGGIPTIASLMSNCLLYRFDDVEMMAFYIEKHFNNIYNASVKELAMIHQRHNPTLIAEQMINIYRTIHKKA